VEGIYEDGGGQRPQKDWTGAGIVLLPQVVSYHGCLERAKQVTKGWVGDSFGAAFAVSCVQVSRQCVLPAARYSRLQ
jgi:hypothetical protein